MTRVLAVDFGASSVRVCVVDLDRRPLEVEVLHRKAHSPVQAGDGSLRWDWPALIEAVEVGLAKGLAQGPVASIGVDTWGVDYGLLDRRGRLLSAPYSYRDKRTDGWQRVAEVLGPERLYDITGIQLMAFNTVFQLAVHDREELAEAHSLLMLAELVVHHLVGARVGEVTSASTSALVDVRTGDWSRELLEAIGVDPLLMPAIETAGTHVGNWRGVPVHLVGGHDTACAVACMAGEPAPGAAFLASGTWLLVGSERPGPDTSEAARRANFTNEAGALGGTRFLKNVPGFWLLEQCRQQWGDPPVGELMAAAAAVPAGPRFDPHDPDLVAPSDMDAAVRRLAGLSGADGRDVVTRCVVDSMVAGVMAELDRLASLTGAPVSELHVLGGGSRDDLFVRLVQEQTGIVVRRGPAEATALGNALVQGVALRRFDDLAQARRAVAEEARVA